MDSTARAGSHLWCISPHSLAGCQYRAHVPEPVHPPTVSLLLVDHVRVLELHTLDPLPTIGAPLGVVAVRPADDESIAVRGVAIVHLLARLVRLLDRKS